MEFPWQSPTEGWSTHRPAEEAAGVVFQVRMVDLRTGVSEVVVSVDGTTKIIPNVAIAGNKVLWVSRTPSPGQPSDAQLLLTDLASGQTDVLLPTGYSGRAALAEHASVASWSTGVWVGGPGAPLDRVSPLGTVSYVGLAGDWVFWVDQDKHRGFGANRVTGRSVQLPDTYTQNVFVNPDLVVWVQTPALDTPGGGPAASHTLMWIPVARLP